MNAVETSSKGVDVEFRAAMRRFPATVTIVTASDGSRDHGMTVTAVTSVSMSPPSLMVCLNKKTLLHDMLVTQANFAVNVLSHEHSQISEAFSGKIDPKDRFNTATWQRDATGMLVLTSAHANLVCRRMAAVPYGTHTIFVGEVTRVRVNSQTRPLLYAEAAYCISQPAAPCNGAVG